MKPFNAQDAFAQLVEDVRIGQTYRPISDSKRQMTRFVPYRPQIDLNLPVFYMVGDYHHVPHDDAGEALATIILRQFHLPYPRCAFLMSLPGDHPGLRHLASRMHVRHSYIIVAEEDDEQLHFVSFMRNELIDHWVRQLFDIYIPLGSPFAEITTTYDPAWGDYPTDFIAGVEASLWMRLETVLAFVHKMMTHRGERPTATPGTEVTDKINQRRSKMSLPPISQVIAIDLSKLPVAASSGRGTGTGSPKKPHFRKGSWHTRKATGKRSWHPAVAVHGGGEVVPPWYEVTH